MPTGIHPIQTVYGTSTIILYTCVVRISLLIFLNFYSNFAEGARLLLEHGAEINSKDGRENTAAMAAGALGHFEILEVLLGHRLLNIHAGVRQRHSHVCYYYLQWECFYSEVSLFQGLKCMQE